jgi:hypothetical protein
MRGRFHPLQVVLLLALGCATAAAQSPDGEPLNLRELPPPPPEYAEIPGVLPLPETTSYALLSEALPRLAGTVEVPGGTRLEVVLDTPLSTRISRTGQRVVFRTEEALPLQRGLMLPAGTAVVGEVVDAARPGGFGRAGRLRVSVDAIELPSGTRVETAARLTAADPADYGGKASDNNRVTDLVELAQWSLLGTWIGREVKGGKGAAAGAGAGAAVALILMASRRGPDLYLEPGTPFHVVLQAPVALSASEVASAHYAALRTGQAERARAQEFDDDPPRSERTRPELKRRPRR